MVGTRYYKNLDFSKPVATHRYVDVTGLATKECSDYENMEYIMDAACRESWEEFTNN